MCILIFKLYFYKIIHYMPFGAPDWQIRCLASCIYKYTKAVARGVPQVHVHPPFKIKKNYILCRISFYFSFYTNNPKCQYVYLSFYLNDYQIIDKVNTI